MAVAMPVMSNGGKTYTIKLKPGILFQPPISRESRPTTSSIVGATAYQAGNAGPHRRR